MYDVLDKLERIIRQTLERKGKINKGKSKLIFL
jgi:hypothetical protein